MEIIIFFVLYTSFTNKFDNFHFQLQGGKATFSARGHGARDRVNGQIAPAALPVEVNFRGVKPLFLTEAMEPETG